MTGQELIDWIKEHHAEEMKVVAQYRDSGGIFLGFDEDIVPCVYSLYFLRPQSLQSSVDREVIVL